MRRRDLVAGLGGAAALGAAGWYAVAGNGAGAPTAGDGGAGVEPVTIPSSIREEFELEQGTKLMVVPTEYGLVLKNVDLPSVEEFQQRIEQRADAVDCTRNFS